MKQELKKILELNHTAKIKDFVQVKTYASYIKQNDDRGEDILLIKKNMIMGIFVCMYVCAPLVCLGP